MFGLGRDFIQAQQCQKSLLNHILGFRVRKPERAAVKHQLRSLGVIQSFAPRQC